MSKSEVGKKDDGRLLAEDEKLAREELARREAEAEMEVSILDAARALNADPVQPTRLKSEDSFKFRCHKGVSCWNACCHDTDITLTPFDILRLARHFEVRPKDILHMFTLPALSDKCGLPVAKLRVRETPAAMGKPCVFLDEKEGCTVYKDRPVSCRYYPLGLAAVKMKGHDKAEDFYFLVREKHCQGHLEEKEQTVGDFRAEQGIEEYDLNNRGFVDILMKMASWKTLGGPWGKDLEPRTKRMFFMATTDVDAFRRFVFETRFFEIYDVDPDLRERLQTDDELILRLAFDWLKHILFNEPTIRLKPAAMKDAIAKARRDMG
ncbi:MAG: YkgJ family cysteine cluster protein, partial [Hyphomicrobiaceae bacterium]